MNILRNKNKNEIPARYFNKNEIPAGYFGKMVKMILSCREPVHYNSVLRILIDLEKRYGNTRELRGIRLILSDCHPFVLNPFMT